MENIERSNSKLLPYFYILGCVAFFSFFAFYLASNRLLVPYDTFGILISELDSRILLVNTFIPSFVGSVSGLIAKDLIFFGQSDIQAQDKTHNDLIIKLVGGVSTEIALLIFLITLLVVPQANYLHASFTIGIFYYPILGTIAATTTNHVTLKVWVALIFSIFLIFFISFQVFFGITFSAILGLLTKYFKNALFKLKHNKFLAILILIASCWFGIGLGAFLKLGKMSLFGYISLFGLGGFLLIVFLIDVIKYKRGNFNQL